MSTASPVEKNLTGPVVLRVEGISKTYHSGARTVPALVDVDLNVNRGEFLSVIGASGCGKSTLLSIIAGLDAPTGGSVTADGRVSLMFQDATLLPWLTARGNVELALKLRGVQRGERADRAREPARRGPSWGRERTPPA